MTVFYRLVVSTCFVYLLLPVILIIPISFSRDDYLTFPPSGFSLRWYEALWRQTDLLHAFAVSAALAAAVTIVTLVVAIPAAYAIVRMKVPGSDALYNVFTAPLLLPTIVLGLAVLIVFGRIGVLGTYQGVLLGHLLLTLPSALRVLVTALATLPLDVEEAAGTLGARPTTILRRITLPAMVPGIVASAALSFLVSFDEVTLTLFLAGPEVTTLPVQLFHYVETKTDPIVASISVVLIALTVVIIFLVEKSIGLSRAFIR